MWLADPLPRLRFPGTTLLRRRSPETGLLAGCGLFEVARGSALSHQLLPLRQTCAVGVLAHPLGPTPEVSGLGVPFFPGSVQLDSATLGGPGSVSGVTLDHPISDTAAPSSGPGPKPFSGVSVTETGPSSALQDIGSGASLGTTQTPATGSSDLQAGVPDPLLTSFSNFILPLAWGRRRSRCSVPPSGRGVPAPSVSRQRHRSSSPPPAIFSAGPVGSGEQPPTALFSLLRKSFAQIHGEAGYSPPPLPPPSLELG